MADSKKGKTNPYGVDQRTNKAFISPGDASSRSADSDLSPDVRTVSGAELRDKGDEMVLTGGAAASDPSDVTPAALDQHERHAGQTGYGAALDAHERGASYGAALDAHERGAGSNPAVVSDNTDLAAFALADETNIAGAAAALRADRGDEMVLTSSDGIETNFAASAAAQLHDRGDEMLPISGDTQEPGTQVDDSSTDIGPDSHSPY